jgi:hypothetical protein
MVRIEHRSPATPLKLVTYHTYRGERGKADFHFRDFSTVEYLIPS